MGGVVNTISSAVATVTAPVTDAIARSDIGKVAGGVGGNAVKAATVDAPVKALNGDFSGAFSSVTGSYLNSNPVSQAINSSTSFYNGLNTKEGNNLTLGWGSDAVRATDAQNNLQGGGTVDARGVEDIVRYSGRSAVYGTAIGAGLAAGLGQTVSTAVMANPGTALTVGALAAQGKYGQIASSVADKYIPGSGTIINNLTNPPAGSTNGNVSRLPASGASPDAGSYYYSGPGSSLGLDTPTLVAIAGGAVLFIIVLVRRLR